MSRKSYIAMAAAIALAITITAGEVTASDYDKYGRPLPSDKESCRQGQMAGGPITDLCARNGYRFNEMGQLLVNYRFDQWGYDVLDRTVTEQIGHRLDSDAKFRAEYIKQHGFEAYRSKKQVSKTSPALSSAQYQLDPTHRYILRCNQYLELPIESQQSLRERETKLSLTGESQLVNSGKCSLLDGAEIKSTITIDATSGGMVKATVSYPQSDTHTVGYFFRDDLITIKTSTESPGG